MPNEIANCKNQAQILEVSGDIYGKLSKGDADEVVIRSISEMCDYCILLSSECFPVVRCARRGTLNVVVISSEID